MVNTQSLLAKPDFILQNWPVKTESQNEAAYWDGVRADANANLADLKRRYGAFAFSQDHISFRNRKKAAFFVQEDLFD
jgi:hypothetical protein